jgi:hypothetical protein
VATNATSSPFGDIAINSLTDKLLNALASVEQGANKQAVNQLNALSRL